MARIIVLLFAIVIMVSSCLATARTHKKAGISRRDVPDLKTAVKLAQSGVHKTLALATLSANQELHQFQPKTPSAATAASKRKRARLSRRDVPDLKTAVKLAQSGVHKTLALATLSANQELHLLQPKTPPVATTGNTGPLPAAQDTTPASTDDKSL
ncbi:hypothetical protein [Parasitella parasitica]|uniref:Uncharacterized protein n=1 Tax=Parasitella parasitica TaxID=35722 RepID=A0A0B7NDS2_9FUNG|nr:hypothetical protein [Parasitella parasitica]